MERTRTLAARATTGLAFIAAPLLAFALALRPVENFDLGFILRIGEWVQKSGIPTTDPFSFPGEGQRWVLEQWLGPLAFWLVYARVGLAGLIVFKALIVAISIALVWFAAREACGDPALAALAALLAAAAGAVRFNAQPFVFSFLGTALVSWALHRLRARRSWRLLLALPLVFALWPHVHPGYLTGLAALCAFTAGALGETLLGRVLDPSERRFAGRETAGLAALTLACALASVASLALFHPLGIEPLRAVLGIFSSDQNRQSISEYAPLWRSYRVDAPMLALALLPPLCWALAWRKISLPLAALFVLFVFSAAHVGRLVTDAALILAPIWAAAILLALRTLKGSLNRLTRAATPLRTSLAVAAIALLAAVAPLRSARLDWPEAYYPRSCYDWIEAHALPPRQFNDLWFGGSFIMRFAPERKTFIDGRSFYSDRFFREDYLPIRDAEPGWQKVVQRWGIQWFLLRPDRFRALHEALLRDPHYALVHSEAQCAIYAERAPTSPP